MTFDLRRRLAAEGLGTALLVATVVGSGIMADRLTDDSALALLCNSIATGAVLIVLITIFGPISGAHFNPAVSAVFATLRMMTVGDLVAYVAVQIAGGLIGAIVAHLMFGLSVIDPSLTVRTGPPQWFAEAVATFGLITVIVAGLRFDRQAIPMTVGLYITAAYWFTSSTSFANPAVTIARSVTNTFSGIRPFDAPVFIVAQFAGALVAAWFVGWLIEERV